MVLPTICKGHTKVISENSIGKLPDWKSNALSISDYFCSCICLPVHRLHPLASFTEKYLPCQIIFKSDSDLHLFMGQNGLLSRVPHTTICKIIVKWSKLYTTDFNLVSLWPYTLPVMKQTSFSVQSDPTTLLFSGPCNLLKQSYKKWQNTNYNSMNVPNPASTGLPHMIIKTSHSTYYKMQVSTILPPGMGKSQVIPDKSSKFHIQKADTPYPQDFSRGLPILLAIRKS